jgi:hypothetical protein
MNFAQIETELQALADEPFDPATFIYRFLEIYNAPKATLTKLKQGSGNHAVEAGDVLWKTKLFYRSTQESLPDVADTMLADPLVKKHNPRFLFVTDGADVYCRDLKTDQTIDPRFTKLNEHFMFFLPLANIERYEAPTENPADIKATGRVAKLYDAILEANADWIERDYTHDLNQFMTRLLFCFFAEDTSIFEKNVFTSTVINRTQEDGSDTAAVLDLIFESMNTKRESRSHLPEYAKQFPYVNGGLFRDKTQVPKFSKRARRLLKECGELYWSDINPDIFGSMIQAVAQPGLREDMGMHYTSVPNIMKVLQPLFLISLEEEFEAAKESEPKLKKLLQRIYSIRVFDPACGSGNFLIIAYKELRKLEMRVFERQKAIAKQWSLPMTEVALTQFYGIELTDFATETAKLSLWIAEYQMNEMFKATFGKAPPALPLRESGNIVHGNAALVDWTQVCPQTEDRETYIVGNPPYLGRADQTKEQKTDMAKIFAPLGVSYKNLDYVACWYAKAAHYCKSSRAQCALVTTNSICQGEQVALLWPIIYKNGLEIGFAHQPFKWRNSAAKNAAVTCVIVGIRAISKANKVLYSDAYHRRVSNISPYLVEGEDIFVTKRRTPISFEKDMTFGSMANDGGNLLLSASEKDEILSRYPEATKFFKRLYGSQEFSKGVERWCLWIEDRDVEAADEIPPIRMRIEAVRAARSDSDRETTAELAAVPHRFAEVRHKESDAIIVPKNTSERRYYITAGFIEAGSIISDLAFAVYDADPYIFSIISSRLHYVWGASVGGRFKMDPRYSNTLVYNTFPIPNLSDQQKAWLEDLAVEVLGARETHPGKTISWLYDPDNMPSNLRSAHKSLDDALETIYIGRPFTDDVERLQHLFKLYSAAMKKDNTKTKGRGAA